MAAVERKLSESERKLVEANEQIHNQEKAYTEAFQKAKILCKEALQKEKSAIASKFNCIN